MSDSPIGARAPSGRVRLFVLALLLGAIGGGAIACGNRSVAAAPSAPAATLAPSTTPPASSTPSASPAVDGWERYESPDGFAVDAPVAAVTSEQGSNHRTLFSHPGGTYSVDWYEFPPNSLTESQLLAIQTKRVVKAIEGKPSEARDLTLDSHPGVAVRIDGKGDAYLFRLYVVDSRFYQVAASLPHDPSAANLRDGERFLDSFQLTGG